MNRFLPYILSLLSFNMFSQEKPKWNVNNPPGQSKDVQFTATEGTWLNLDVSPDGKTIVFDLLGDIYSMPISGGQATCLRSGLAWEVQPRWSPDGNKILFTSDVEGGDNIFYMDYKGENVKQVTKESFRLLNNAIWMPDGQYIIARKHFSSSRSLGAGEMWMYHISGGEGMQLTKRKNDQQDVNEPCISPDGKKLYYSEDMYPGGYFQYNKDPNNEIFVIQSYDFETGEIIRITGGSGGACRPQISHDGKFLAFVRRIRENSALFIRELATGKEWPLYNDLSKDQQEAWTIFGVYTGFNWTPDDKNIIIWAKGKIQKIDVQTKKAVEIPFKVTVNHKLMETVEFENPAFENEFEVKVLRNLATSPDGKKVVFSALGKLYVSDNFGTPKTLFSGEYMEAEPSFSFDGKKLVYVTWNDETLGTIKLYDFTTGQTKTLTKDPAIYRTPSFSPDGNTIVYRKEGGNGHQGYLYSLEAGIYTMKVEGGEPEFITGEGEKPQFSATGKEIFFTTGGFLFGSISKAFKKYNIEDKKTLVVFNTSYTTNFVPSPDNNWIAFTELHKVYISPMPVTGQPIGISAKTKAVPVAQVAKDAGYNLHWSSDSKKLLWSLGNEYFSAPLEKRFLFLEGAPDSIPPMDSTGVKILLKVKSDKPVGKMAFKNAQIITMENNQVIKNGTVVVEGNKIVYVGGAGGAPIDKNTKVYDVKGKTIMPGLVDVHAHLGAFRDGISPQKHWEYFANLAFGVTTTHDPSSNSEITFAQSEMVKAGVLTGPRIFSTGTILYGADGDFKAEINSLEDAKSAIRRTKALGAFSVKSYNQPRREQRQQVIEAARQLGIRVVPEGGSFFYHNLSMVADGHTSIEHNLPVAPLYHDVIQFWSRTKTSNTPTLIVNYGGINGEYYWYQNTEVWKNKKLLTFTPRPVIDARSRHRTMVPDEEYENGHILTSKSLKKLNDQGVKINLGSHGQIQGLGAHWELWMFQQGGMTNYEALKCATINGAKLLGMEKEIGSLKVGKLADLIVIDGNPLLDIRKSEKVIYTMINGRLYDTENMDEIGHTSKTRSKFFWELEGSGNIFPFFSDTHGIMGGKCACGL
ncbi:MAG: PD40 domain-containing protein [Saprospiraceae bacterium]|nr:PD40 domain-containing protein [Saprospiraceae bacterium]MBK9042153.1 PD40 domain-containing protein [Saprospiraceae bacterium]